MQKANPLIRTKLRLPFTRLELVPRPRLQARLAEGLRGPLTLIVAPAGFGKTTLVASWIAGCGMSVAWLSLDRNDNQTDRFLGYLIAAVQQADNTLGSEAAGQVASIQQQPPEAVLTSLINDLDTTDREIVLVLDDYQLISNQAVHEAVAFLLEHCPRTFHLVIATRSDPPLPLTRFRARGQAVELRAADLRFTEGEAAQFLNNVMGLNLDAGSVTVLEERTEGWIAGLQMAALSMRDREDVAGFIEGFSGTNRYILDYLLDEVLVSQSLKIEHFLLHTSILERLTAPLCDALLAKDEAAKKEGDDQLTHLESFYTGQSASILEYLERANLFLVPLDDERAWYRYHHLFADLLRTKLQSSLGIQGVGRLHLRAAAWYEQNNLILEAIQHASMVSDDEMVEQLIEQYYMEMFHRGEASSMRFWTGKLSKELIYRRPWLCIYEAQSHALFGQLDEADVLLARAEKHLQIENPAADTKSMLGHLAYIKSRVTGMRGDVHRAIELSLIARENTPASNQALQSGIGVMLGVGYFLNGDFANAIQVFNETIHSGIAANAINGTVAAYCHLARLYAIQGQLHKSYELYQEAGKFAQEAGGRNRGVMSLVDMGIANVLYELNDLEGAQDHIKHALGLIPFWGNADDIVLAHTTHARIQQAQGNEAGAVETIEKGIYLIQTRGVFSAARDAVRTAQVKLWLAQGDLPSADRWAASQEERLSSDDRFGFENELTNIAEVRVLIAQNKLDDAIYLLFRLEESARACGRQGRLIEIMILKALAMQSMGDTERADIALTESMAMAESEGYVRIYLDEGWQMEELLQAYSGRAEGALKVYADQLLEAFTTAPSRVTSILTALCQPQPLVEPLTEREAEVLGLLAAGLSNWEIAERLVLSEGTIKTHAHNLYGKLGVSSRTQAIVRAKELNLI